MTEAVVYAVENKDGLGRAVDRIEGLRYPHMSCRTTARGVYAIQGYIIMTV